ncbi:unnamed protein product [Caenorhabditis auriculariae]|uniref:Uncharacterized protein n=1 Tax=Caenorhabditis auriculariae TaxID=2777116 RepID=A0A8S1HUS1_9PELO|nr:unnamed protein product [Caenorhabditis auriculariae]
MNAFFESRVPNAAYSTSDGTWHTSNRFSQGSWDLANAGSDPRHTSAELMRPMLLAMTHYNKLTGYASDGSRVANTADPTADGTWNAANRLPNPSWNLANSSSHFRNAAADLMS